MKVLLAAALAASLLAAAVPTQAQTPTGVTLTIDGPTSVPYLGSGAIPFTVTAGCLSLLSALGGDAAVTVTDAPAWFTFEEQTIALDPSACDANGQTQASGSLPFTVTDAAPGVVQNVVHLKATLGEESSEAAATYTVAYKSKFSLTPSVTFPLAVTNKTTTFTVTGVQASNAPSMIMVDDFSADNGALIAGIGALQYANTAGSPETKTYTVTFTAPNKEWTTATATLAVYGHYNFDGMAGDPEDRTTFTWEFTNGGVDLETTGESGGKESPAPVFAFVAIGLLAFAAVRRKA